MQNISISVIVSVKNEANNLPHCLKKLSDFSEIIVVDSNSTDGTPQIASEFGYTLVNFTWNGKFPKKRNWTLENIEMENEWVLFLDADEVLTDEFINEVSTIRKNPKYSGYWLNYNNYFMGKQLKFGDKMRKLALFKKDAGRYERIEENNWSHLDMEIHEHPVIMGRIGQIKSPIIHNDYKGLEHYIAKHNAYSSWEAKRYLSLKSSDFNQLTFRQRLKYRLINTGLLPIIYFIGTYILKGGFLDGKEGYALARFKANYFFQIKMKIKELISGKRITEK